MHVLPPELKQALCREFNVAEIEFTAVGGGSINHTGKILFAGKSLFLKWNTLKAYPKMFEAEYRGLKILISANSIDVIEPILFGQTENIQYLVLRYNSSSVKRPDFWNEFGEQLALLHSTTSEMFGLDHDNYMGALSQCNSPTRSWIEFFIYNRLQPQVALALERDLISTSTANAFEALYGKLGTLLPEEKPSLVHGDLWAGNLMANEKGLPVLIDPATYFGNAEVDLAMTTLFGGFDPIFIDSYTSVKPLILGFKSRFDLYNLYPLLIHVNLFGKSYLPQVVSILKKYV